MKTVKIVATAPREVEMYIYDVIGEDWWTGGGITAVDVTKQLDDAGPLDKIIVRINSPGGDVFDGMAIYNALVRNSARVVVEIDCLAASAASFIAMAGEEINMAENAFMMIHRGQS